MQYIQAYLLPLSYKFDFTPGGEVFETLPLEYGPIPWELVVEFCSSSPYMVLPHVFGDKRFKIKDGKSLISSFFFFFLSLLNLLFWKMNLLIFCQYFLFPYYDDISLLWVDHGFYGRMLRHLVVVEQKFHLKGEQKAFSFIVKICYAMSRSDKIVRPMSLLLLVPLTKNLIFSNFTTTIDSRDFWVAFSKALTFRKLVQLSFFLSLFNFCIFLGFLQFELGYYKFVETMFFFHSSIHSYWALARVVGFSHKLLSRVEMVTISYISRLPNCASNGCLR